MSHHNPNDHQQPQSQFILLGASNLVLGLPWILTHLEHGLRCSPNILAACGHGRSYGQRTSVLGRSLPGILDCGIWDHLSHHPADRHVLITDVGNDIMYGATAETIADWVRTCIDRCQPTPGQLLMTQLPFDSLARLTDRKFRLIKAVMFPRHQVTWPIVASRSQQLGECLRDIAADCGAQLIEPELAWYGFDPIHIRRVHRRRAWQHIFSHWDAWDTTQNARSPGPWKCLKSWCLRPQQRQLLGYSQLTSQPVIDRDCLKLSLF